MNDLARTYSLQFQCRENETYESMQTHGGEPFACGNTFTAYAFFIMFQLVCMQVFLNLFVAIIIDAFLGQAEMYSLPIQQYYVNEFARIWCHYDPDATGFIKMKDLEALIVELAKSDDGQGLIVLKELVLKDLKTKKRFIGMLKIPTYDKFRRVMFYDVLQ